MVRDEEEEQQKPAAKRIKTELHEDETKLPPTQRQSSNEEIADDAAAPLSVTSQPAAIKQEKEPEGQVKAVGSSAAAVAIKQEPHEDQEEATVTTEGQDNTAFHFHFHCPVHPFDHNQSARHQPHCEKCLCYACNIPAGECVKFQWSHWRARDSSLPWKVQHDTNVEIQQWLQNPTINLFDRLSSDWKFTGSYEQKHQECRESPFYYPTKAAFQQALKIYNMQSNRKDNLHGHVVVKQRHSFQRNQVRGRHKIPCFDCKRPFLMHQYYFCDEYDTGWHSSTKYCLGCMGRIVAFHVSPDASMLDELQQEQEARIESLWQECIRENGKRKTGLC